MSSKQSSSRVAGRLAVFSTLAACCALLAEYILISQEYVGYFGFVGFLMAASICLWSGFYFFAKKYQTAWFDEVTHNNKELQLQALFSTLNPWPILRFDRYGQLISKNSCAKTYFYTLEYGASGQRSVFDFFPELSKDDWQVIVHESQPYQLEYNRSGYWLCFFFRVHAQLGVINVYGYDVTSYKRQENERQKMQKNAIQNTRHTSQLLQDVFRSLHEPAKSLQLALQKNPQIQQSSAGQDIQAIVDVIHHLDHISELDANRFKIQTHSFDCRFMFEKLVSDVSKELAFQDTEVIVDCDFGELDFVMTDGRRLQQALGALLRYSVARSKDQHILVKARWSEKPDSSSSLLFADAQQKRMFFKVSVHDSGGVDDRVLQFFSDEDNKEYNLQGTDLNLRFLATLMPLIGGRITAQTSPLGGHELKLVWPVDIAPEHKVEDQSQSLNEYRLHVYDALALSAEVVAKTLARSGASVEYSHDKAAFVEALRQNPPDVVVYSQSPDQKVDQELFDHIRQLTSEVMPICLLVSQGEDLRQDHFNDLDIESIVVKPIRSRLLIQGIKHAWAMKGLKRERIEAVEEQSKQVTPVPAAEGRPYIVVVDDDVVVLHLLSDLLTEMGAHVEVAESGFDALDILSRAQVDLVIMDVRMPGMDGFEATQEIRAKYGDEIPIVALTASNQQTDRAKALQIGMNDYLVKPVDKAVLVQRLGRWVYFPSIDALSREQQTLSTIDDDTPLVQVREAMRLLNQDKTLFTRSLLRFYGRFYAEGLKIAQLLESDETGDIIRRLHTLRSGAANIGAYVLRDEIFLIENLLREEEVSVKSKHSVFVLISLLARVLEETRMLLDHFMAGLDQSGSGVIVTHDESFDQKLQTLKTSVDELHDSISDSQQDSQQKSSQ